MYQSFYNLCVAEIEVNFSLKYISPKHATQNIVLQIIKSTVCISKEEKKKLLKKKFTI